MPVFIQGQVTFTDAALIGDVESLKYKDDELIMLYSAGLFHDNTFFCQVAVQDDKLYFKRTHTYNNVLYEAVFGKNAQNGAIACIKKCDQPVMYGPTYDTAKVMSIYD